MPQDFGDTSIHHTLEVLYIVPKRVKVEHGEGYMRYEEKCDHKKSFTEQGVGIVDRWYGSGKGMLLRYLLDLSSEN